MPRPPPRPRRDMRGTLAPVPRVQVLLAALCFGTTGTAQALGPGGASPLTVGAVRVGLGAALLLLAVRLAAGSPAVRLARGPLAVGGLRVAGHQLCFFPPRPDTRGPGGPGPAPRPPPAVARLGRRRLPPTPPGR